MVRATHLKLVQQASSDGIASWLAALGAEPVGSKPEEFAAFIKTEIPKYAKVVKASGAKAD